MINLSFSIGRLVVTPLVLGLALATIFASFSFWRRLREDFKEEEVFNMTLWIMVSAIFFARLFFVLFNFSTYGLYLAEWVSLSFGDNFSLTGAFVGAVLSVVWKLSQKKRNFWEVLDNLVFAWLIFLIPFGLGAWLTRFNYWALGYSLIGTLGALFFLKFKKKYRSFVWYKSGKTGFLFSLVSCLTLCLLAGVAFLKNHQLYLEGLIQLILAAASLGLLYWRSERELREDLRIKKWRK
jgi:prolipoprotein diacylglyceryltransferase